MVTTRSANVVVENRTGAKIRAISIVHKYSDVHKERHVHAELNDGETSAAGTVKYNTGFGTTGRDWWLVAWHDESYSNMYYTNPTNFRGIIDMLEGIAPSVLQLAISTASDAGKLDEQAAAAASELASKVTDSIFNSETTSGFKQHILRSEDENQTVRIILESDSTVRITSPSGDSSTKYSSKTT